MNPKRAAGDLSASTFNQYKRNGKLPWTALFAESVEALRNPKLSDRARTLWLFTQPIFGKHDGYLLDDSREPMNIPTLANRLWRPADQVSQDIEKLIKFDILRRENGIILDPFMVNDKGSQNRLEETASERGKVDDQIETYLNRQRSPSENANGTLPQYSNSTVQGFSSGGTANQNLKPTSTNDLTETDREKSGESATLPPLFHGLSENDLDEVFSKHTNKDCPKVYRKFYEYHKKKGTEKVTRKQLEGWFANHKGDNIGEPEKSAKPVETTKEPVKPVKTQEQIDAEAELEAELQAEAEAELEAQLAAKKASEEKAERERLERAERGKKQEELQQLLNECEEWLLEHDKDFREFKREIGELREGGIDKRYPSFSLNNSDAIRVRTIEPVDDWSQLVSAVSRAISPCSSISLSNSRFSASYARDHGQVILTNGKWQGAGLPAEIVLKTEEEINAYWDQKAKEWEERDPEDPWKG